jgi:hypothetical protein
MEPAGTIVSEQPPDDPAYAPCDGRYVDGWRFPDYRRRCGGRAGAAGIGLYRKPIAPGFSVRLVDDPAAADPPADGYSIDNPPPPWQLWINPVADKQTGSDTVTVTAEGHMEPVTATLAGVVASLDEQWLSPPLDIAVLSDGTLMLECPAVPVGDSYHFRIWVVGRPDITAQSNDFEVTAT